jgi:hypothetical protein
MRPVLVATSFGVVVHGAASTRSLSRDGAGARMRGTRRFASKRAGIEHRSTGRGFQERADLRWA